MLSLSKAGFVRQGRIILRDISLAVAPGEILVLVGPNGAGKSTLLRLMSGELLPVTGEARLDSKFLATWEPRRLAARRAVLPQRCETPPHFTTEALVGLGLPLLGLGRRPELVAQSLAEVGLTGQARHEAVRLSGGQQQRAHFARALVQLRAASHQPGLLLLDEPLAAQDLRHQLLVLELTRRHVAQGGSAVLVLHDLNWAARIATRIVVLHEGGIYAEGPPASLLTRRMLAEVYGVHLQPGTVPASGQPFILPQMAAWPAEGGDAFILPRGDLSCISQ